MKSCVSESCHGTEVIKYIYPFFLGKRQICHVIKKIIYIYIYL